MPYTPPSQQSPASSKSTSPALSRSSSYSEDGPRSPVTGRPQLPRSHSAASSYMHRHRRSPSITKADGPPTPTEGLEDGVQAADFAQRGTVRQSPPPVNNLLIPTGAIISPPDSSENSDGDDGKDRGRELEIKKLQAAVRSIDQRREGSPDKDGDANEQRSTSEPVSQTVSPTALTAEARKIAHSRSSTETAIIIPRAAHFSVSPTHTSDDSDDDDDDSLLSKPSLVRKKSGELVKPALRPSSRRRYSSMPGTPTYSKSVHFNDNDNQTRHFLQVDKPMAVSAGSSPVETYDSESEYPFDRQSKIEREIKLVNFPADSFDRSLKPVRVERIFLSPDQQTLVGSVAVQNIAFHKLVVARFTLDYWKTTSEVVAEFNNDPRHPTTDGCDRFNFHIKLSDQANIDNKTLLLCVRYNVNGQEYWDNNDGQNYHIDFTKSLKKSSSSAPTSQLGARPLSAIPRSRHSPPTSSHGRNRHTSHDDDFGTRFDTASAYQFGSNESLFDEPSSTIKLKPKTKLSNPFSTDQTQPHNNLGGRYDFGASLSAALSNAQDKLGRNSGLMNGTAHKANGSYFGPIERKIGATATINDRPEVSSDRPPIGSEQYRDLVQKFCYFTPTGTGKGSTSPQTSRSVSSASLNSEAGKSATSQPDGADDEVLLSSSSSSSSSWSSSSSGTNSPTPHAVESRMDRTGASPVPSIVISRSSSPALRGQDYTHRAASPGSFGYPYHNSMRDGYFESPYYTAIRG